MAQILIRNLIRQLNELDTGSRWFDQCFQDRFKNLTEAEAFTRPIPEVHSVAEHISHLLEWRKECLRRWQGTKTDLMNSAEDWKDNQVLQEMGWDNLKKLFFESTTTLIRVLEAHDDSFLETQFQDTDYTFHYLIEGIIQHDLYHLGQIGITLKLLKRN